MTPCESCLFSVPVIYIEKQFEGCNYLQEKILDPTYF